MLQDLCNWRQWSMNEGDTDNLIKAKKEQVVELRAYSYGKIPTDISAPGLLRPSDDHKAKEESTSTLDIHRSQNLYKLERDLLRKSDQEHLLSDLEDSPSSHNSKSLVIPSTSFVIPRRQLKVTNSNHIDGDSAIVRRYSDIIFANHDHLPSSSFSNDYLKDNIKRVHQGVTHHLSHNIGIDEIGLDYMRANGAIPAFKHLQHSLSKPTDNKSSKTSLINCLSRGAITQSRSFDKTRSTTVLQQHTEDNDHTESGSKEKVHILHSTSQGYKSKDNKDNHPPPAKSMKSVGYRLGRRKELFEKRLRISDFSLSFAIFGILVMVIDSELLWAGIYSKNSIYSILLKSLISISTLVLLGLVLAYHALVIQLFSCDDAIEDWKIAITWHSVAQLCLELTICSIHPVPGDYSISIYFTPKNSTVTSGRLEYMIEPMLSLPMLLRFYMIFRSLLLHSRMFRDAGSRSIGAMNKVSFDTRFILKTLMTMNPGTMLLTFILSLWILLSWTMRMCEINTETPMHANLLNCMWLIAVTFLSIGYGDIVPHTHCGRGIAVSAGVMGSACTALLVAVFARKLELSKAEKHVTQFMLENQMTKKLKYYAANVLRETWLIYKYTKLVKYVNASKVRTHQRKFLKAIHGLRKLKIDQRKFKDNSNTLVDLAKTQTNIYETVTEMRVDHSLLEQRISRIENNLQTLQEQLKNLPDILSNILTIARNNCTLTNT